jgi:hypothetical protein
MPTPDPPEKLMIDNLSYSQHAQGEEPPSLPEKIVGPDLNAEDGGDVAMESLELQAEGNSLESPGRPQLSDISLKRGIDTDEGAEDNEVLVGHEPGDPARPIEIGALYNESDAPPPETGQPTLNDTDHNSNAESLSFDVEDPAGKQDAGDQAIETFKLGPLDPAAAVVDDRTGHARESLPDAALLFRDEDDDAIQDPPLGTTDSEQLGPFSSFRPIEEPVPDGGTRLDAIEKDTSEITDSESLPAAETAADQQGVLQAIAAAAGEVPVIGPIIAAIIAAIAAVVVLIGNLVSKRKEDEAAAKEKEAQPKAGSSEDADDSEIRASQDSDLADDDPPPPPPEHISPPQPPPDPEHGSTLAELSRSHDEFHSEGLQNPGFDSAEEDTDDLGDLLEIG